MAELGAGSGSGYPAVLDTDNTLEVNSPNAGKTKARAEVPNDLAAAIVAIETELGINPAGSLTDVKTFLQTDHDADGTHSADITLTTPTIGDFTNATHTHVSNAQGGELTGMAVQVVYTQTGAVATGTTVSPDDDNIPQNDEGDEYITLAITPTDTNNKLLIEASLNFASSVANHMVAALFQDTTANALASGGHRIGANNLEQIFLRHEMTAGTTSSTTFKIRIGGESAGTTTFNGHGGARKHGGVLASNIRITEVQT